MIVGTTKDKVSHAIKSLFEVSAMMPYRLTSSSRLRRICSLRCCCLRFNRIEPRAEVRVYYHQVRLDYLCDYFDSSQGALTASRVMPPESLTSLRAMDVTASTNLWDGGKCTCPYLPCSVSSLLVYVIVRRDTSKPSR